MHVEQFIEQLEQPHKQQLVGATELEQLSVRFAFIFTVAVVVFSVLAIFTVAVVLVFAVATVVFPAVPILAVRLGVGNVLRMLPHLYRCLVLQRHRRGKFRSR